MGKRKTRLAGLLQSRHADPKVQRTFDAIIERLEVLDGLRGDALDKAITYRDLELSGFTIDFGGAGGGPQITNTPGGGDGTTPDGPGIGPPSGPPANLTVTETFLALLVAWDQPSFNVQHIEVWRHDVDNLSLATMIGASHGQFYMDYVGASASYYYWVRALGTDGTYSPYNATAGTLGTTGIDPSDFELELNISASNLDTLLGARIDLIDDPTTGLVTRVTAAEGDILALDGRTTTLESSVSDVTTDVSGNTALIVANAGLIATQTTSISQLTTDMVTALDGVAANSSSITANASDILNLEAAIGALDSSGGIEWEFLTDISGWTTNNSTLTHSGAGTGSVIWTPTALNPSLESPAFGVSGGIFTQVVMRVRRTIGGGTWEGSVFYATGGHPFSGSFRKDIAEPTLPLGEWQTLTWDMSNLTIGSTDWTSSTIAKLRFDLVSDAAGKFEIDWIVIAKFSTTAIAEAIEAIDVRVTANESSISAQGTQLTALEATVNSGSGVVATAAALAALTVTVTDNAGDISSNSGSIVALQSTVNDGSTGVVANASAVSVLQTDVSTVEGTVVSHASDITQLVARISGGYSTIVNPLTTQSENFGTSYTTGEIQPYNVGGRSGVAARIDTASNVQDFVYRSDGLRFRVNPNDIFEVKFSVYHNRPTTAGTFYMGLYAYAAVSGGAIADVQIVNDGVAGSLTSNPYWINYRDAVANSEWLDITCYILGSDVDPSKCPNMVINGDTSNSLGVGYHLDGLKIVGAPYVSLRFLNFNASPSYGDDTTTTTYVTDLQVHRIDSAAENYAAIETQASVTATSVGDLNALYAVKVEVNNGGQSYVSGFGIATDVINGTATSAFGVQADQFFITFPTQNVSEANEVRPFTVGLVDGVSTVGIQGQLIVDGTIRAVSIGAGEITAGLITVADLQAVSSDTGTLRVERLTTGIDGTAPAYTDQTSWRVEVQNTTGNTWPFWYGSQAKSEATGRVYMDDQGNVKVRGLLDAGMIKQSFFTPSTSVSSFRIACDYPSNYSGGVYTGKAAHLSPVVVVNETPRITIPSITVPHYSSQVTFYGPTYSTTRQYGRLGSTSEIINLDIYVTASASDILDEFSNPSAQMDTSVVLQYKYDSGPWTDAFSTDIVIKLGGMGVGGGSPVQNTGTATFSAPFITKGSAFSTLAYRLKVGHTATSGSVSGVLETLSLRATTANFGISDLATTVVAQVANPVPVPIEDVPQYPRYIPNGQPIP